MKICGRCDRPIKDGEKYTSYDIQSASGAGTTEYFHNRRCQAVPIQTKQVSPQR